MSATRFLSALTASALALAAFPACDSKPNKRTEQALNDLQKRKEDEAKKKKEEKLAPVPTEVVIIDPPYNDAGSVIINPDGPCPEGLWALFPDVPGGSPEEKKANTAKKKELAESFKGKQFLVRLRGPGQVTLLPYDAPKGLFPLEVVGTIDCTDSIGRIAIAWTQAKAGDPGASAAKQGSEVTQNVWMAPPWTIPYDMKSQEEAKAFKEKNQLGLSARVVFTLGKTAVDKKLKRIGKVTEEAAGEKLGFGGGVEDWGAGRMVRAEVVGVRVATEREKKQLFEKKGQP